MYAVVVTVCRVWCVFAEISSTVYPNSLFDLSGALLCFQGQINGLLTFGIFKQYCSYDSICYLFSRRYVLLVVGELYFLLKFLTLSSVVTKDSFIFAMHD